MFALAGVVMGIVLLLFSGALKLASWNVHGRGLSMVTAFTGNMRHAIEVSMRTFSGRDETVALKRENTRLVSELAFLRDVREENEFLRRIADLPARGEYQALTGGVFSYSVVGQELQTVINIGSRDGVSVGSSVVTESGALLGIVSHIRERSSAVVVLGDPSLQITGRVMGTEIGGLVRVDQTGQLVLDLIGKDESVDEEQMIVSSGLDNVPPGLLIGTIRSVDAERTTLFQIIRIDPAHKAESVWRVLVLVR